MLRIGSVVLDPYFPSKYLFWKKNKSSEFLLKSRIHSNNIEKLLAKIDREFKKITDSLAEELTNLDKSLGRLNYFKKFYDLYSICLLEICNEIQLFGLDYFCVLLLKLFSCFKLFLIFFMKYNSQFLNMRNSVDSDLEIGIWYRKTKILIFLLKKNLKTLNIPMKRKFRI